EHTRCEHTFHVKDSFRETLSVKCANAAVSGTVVPRAPEFFRTEVRPAVTWRRGLALVGSAYRLDLNLPGFALNRADDADFLSGEFVGGLLIAQHPDALPVVQHVLRAVDSDARSGAFSIGGAHPHL